MKNLATGNLVRLTLTSTAILACSLLVSDASAQILERHLRLSKAGTKGTFIGLEGGAITAAYSFSSDIDDLNNLKVQSQGWNTGILLGSRDFKFRATYGKLNSNKAADKSIRQSLISTKVSLSIPGLFNKSKYLRTYVLAGADYRIFSFDGIVIPEFKEPEILITGGSVANCCCPNQLNLPSNLLGFIDGLNSLPPPNPDALSPEISQTSSRNSETTGIESGQVPSKASNDEYNTVQINAGVGLEYLRTFRGRYFRMFAEASYGIPIKEYFNNLSLSKTQITGHMTINLGIGIGINP